MNKKKKKFSVNYKRDKEFSGYNVLFKIGKRKHSIWGHTEGWALEVCSSLKDIYEQGRFDEWEDNNKKCKSLMKKFGV